MPLGAALALFVLLMLLALLPVWPYSKGWGYRPAILFGIVFTFVVVVWVTVLI